MSDPAAPLPTSTGADVHAQDETLKEVAPDASSKGKGKAVESNEADMSLDDDDKEYTEGMEEDETVEQGGDDDEEDDEDDNDDEDEEDEDGDIEPDEVDPANISIYGIGSRPRRARQDIDYSSEEAARNAGLKEDE